jgi:uncharacterized membrane protein
MTDWQVERAPNRSGKAVMALTLLAVLLVAAVPVAFVAGLIIMMLGHVVGGLAVFGGAILAAGIAVAVAGMSGIRHLRKLLTGQGFQVVTLDGSSPYAASGEPEVGDQAPVVRLDRSQYTDVR